MKFASYALPFFMLMEGEATWLIETESDSLGTSDAKGMQKLWKVFDLDAGFKTKSPTEAWSPSEEYPVDPNKWDIVVGMGKYYSPSKGETFLRDGVENSANKILY